MVFQVSDQLPGPRDWHCKIGVLERSKASKENKGFILELNMSDHWPGTTVRLGHPKSHFPTGQQFHEASLVTEQSKSYIKTFEKQRLVGTPGRQLQQIREAQL